MNKSAHLDITTGDLAQIRTGRRRGEVVEVVSVLYKEYPGSWHDNPTLTYCVKEIGREKAFYTLGTNLILVSPAPDPEAVRAIIEK